MGNSRWTLASATALAVVLASTAPTPVHAQGVTTGAISGTVMDEGGRGLENAQIQVINRATGFTSGVITRDGGRYTVSGLPPGGPYTVNVRLIGYQQRSEENIHVSLGQTYRQDFTLSQQAVTLEGLTVTAEQAAIFVRSNKGTVTQFSDSSIRRLPTINRNFTDWLTLTPQVAKPGFGGLSGGGVNHRLNNIQIDGASENDLFGLGSTGQPGGQARGKSVPLDAVKEYQVLLSPYDVRHGNFAGLLINAVTKSGTNDYKVTAFVDGRDNGLARQSDFMKASEFEQRRYGFTVGGPIVRDRAHFFIAPEWQTRNEPATGPFMGQPDATRVPVTQAQIDDFNDALAGWGLPSYGSGARFTKDNPLTNVFGRVDLQLPQWNSRLMVRHNYGRAEDDIFSRSTASNNPTFALTSQAYNIGSTKNGTVAELFTQFSGGSTNEFRLGLNTIRDRRVPMVEGPSILVRVPNQPGFGGNNAAILGGAEQFSQGNELDQDIFEVTNNFTFPVRNVTFVVGTKNEFYKIRNQFTESSYGVWTFDSIDSLRNGDANSYRVAQPLDPAVRARCAGQSASCWYPDVTANVRGAQYGIYGQMQWQPRPGLDVNAGLRADVPVFSNRPTYAPVVEQVFGRRTDQVPSGNIQLSPRIGFNWDISGDRTQQLRGGMGVYVGRPAFVWVANSWQNNGAGLGILNCTFTGSTPGRAPAFEPDINAQPDHCIDRTTSDPVGLATGVVGPVNLMQNDLKFPQTFRSSLAYDRALPGGFVATVEGLYTRGLNNFFPVNKNLKGIQYYDRNHRAVYGTIAGGNGTSTGGQSTPALRDTRFAEVIDIENQSKDYAYQLTGQLQRRFSESFEARAAYTYSKVRDVVSLTSSRAISNWRFGRVVSGDHLRHDRGVSLFDQPHKILLTGTYTMPWERFKTDLSLIYVGQSGHPFAYVYGGFSGRGDLNADGQQGNDPIYVPRDVYNQQEIRFRTIAPGTANEVTIAEQQAAFDSWINSMSCLNEQRGQIMRAGSCRNPWQNYLDLSVRQSLPAFGGHRVALQLDIFNFLNFLNEDWGQVKTAGGFGNVNLLTHVAQTAGPVTVSQPVFEFSPATRKWNSDNLDSNYQLQLSLRYAF